MKVLFLLRQAIGGIATHASDLQAELARRGIHAEIEDASGWIPNDTGPKNDKAVSRKLREISAGYEIVHAFGYRSAWACSEAFGHREAWVYTAYDIPKTTHRVLISHLNDAQAGICASRAVYRALDEAIAIDLVTLMPGVRKPPEIPASKEDCRARHGLPSAAIVIGGLGRLTPEKGWDRLIEAMGIVWAAVPEAILAIAGDGPQRASLEGMARDTHRPDQIRLLGAAPDAFEFLGGLDLCVVPSTRAGFSMAALEAMAMGVPTLVRATGGLPELLEPDISGFVFRADEGLGSQIAEVLDLPLTLQTVGSAGRIRASETFALEPCVEGLVEIYQGIVTGD
jgi:glycosyltransferase involved in cell wall biosynthesis